MTTTKEQVELVEVSDNEYSAMKESRPSITSYAPPEHDFFVGHRPAEIVAQLAKQLAVDGDLAAHEGMLVRGALLANDPKTFYKNEASRQEQRVSSIMNPATHQPISDCH
jgi:hypothetical protein